ncbi:hypothetical protein D3C71_1783280 [compost metagenome]
MIKVRVVPHLLQQFLVAPGAKNKLNPVPPACDKMIHYLVVHNPPASAHDKNGGHVLKPEPLQDVFAAWMLPE